MELKINKNIFSSFTESLTVLTKSMANFSDGNKIEAQEYAEKLLDNDLNNEIIFNSLNNETNIYERAVTLRLLCSDLKAKHFEKYLAAFIQVQNDIVKIINN
jgi:hypothetical protein